MFNLTDKNIYVGSQKILKVLLGDSLIKRHISTDRYRTEGLFSEFDYTNPDGLKLMSGTHNESNYRDGAYYPGMDYFYNFKKDTEHMGSFPTNSSAVFEFVLAPPKHSHSRGTIMSMDFNALDLPLYFFISKTSISTYYLEYFYGTNSSVSGMRGTHGEISISTQAGKGSGNLLLVQFVYKQLSGSSEFQMYINGTLVRSGAGRRITRAAFLQGYINFGNGLFTTPTTKNVNGGIYEMASYYLDHLIPKEETDLLIQANWERANKLYNK